MAEQLDWMNAEGGLEAMVARTTASSDALYGWAEKTAYTTPYVADREQRSLVIGTIDFEDGDRRRRDREGRCAPTASSTPSPTASSAATSCASRCTPRSTPPTSRRSPPRSTTSSSASDRGGARCGLPHAREHRGRRPDRRARSRPVSGDAAAQREQPGDGGAATRLAGPGTPCRLAAGARPSRRPPGRGSRPSAGTGLGAARLGSARPAVQRHRRVHWSRRPRRRPAPAPGRRCAPPPRPAAAPGSARKLTDLRQVRGSTTSRRRSCAARRPTAGQEGAVGDQPLASRPGAAVGPVGRSRARSRVAPGRRRRPW